MSDVRLWAVVPAAGAGERMGAACPKQYLPLAGESVLQHSLRPLLAESRIRRIALVLSPDDSRAKALPLLGDARVERVAGGARRCDSVLAGLHHLARFAAAQDWVLVHDAARPCLADADLQGLIASVLARGEGGLLAQPVLDTLKRADAEGRVLGTEDRRLYWRAQTPQMFRLGELCEALAGAVRAGVEVTDEASAMEWAGYPVHLVSGSAANLKLTLPGDLELAAWYLAHEEGAKH